jgi:hypothetical protein
MKYLAFIVLLTGFGLPMLAFGQTSNTSTEFVPLTNIPALTDLGTGFTLEAFLNGLFRIAIGAAAVIAVLQIMRAGIMYMASDSGFAEKKEAKNLIGLSIGGLVLVLSPVIVFSIINPEILSLKIEGIDKLKPDITSAPAVVVIQVSSAEECRQAGGTVSGDDAALICTVPADSPAAGVSTSCNAFNSKPKVVAPAGASCEVLVSDEYSRIDASCCSEMTAGNQCCGARNETAPAVNLEASISVLKYGYVPNAGAGEDLGPVATDKARYDRYAAACAVAGKEVKNDYGPRNVCSVENVAEYNGPEAYKDYLKCAQTDVSCVAK